MNEDYELYEPYRDWDPFIERDDPPFGIPLFRENGMPVKRKRTKKKI